MQQQTDDPVAVTGAAGFVGAHVVRELTSSGHQCIALDRSTLDLTDKAAVKTFFASRRVETVVHVAAKIPSFGDDTLDNMLRQNVLATENLWEATTGYFIFFSSLDVYGEPTQLPINESTLEDPRTNYAISKLTAEKLLLARARDTDRKLVILRLAHVYGPNDRPIKLIPKVIEQVRRGERPCIFGDGSDLRDFIHVRDVARAVKLILQQKVEGIINLASGTSVSVLDAVTTIIAESGAHFDPVLLPATKKKIAFRFDNRRLRALGFLPRESFASAIRELCR
jgi:UDP-glucose 4-epimerase